MSTGVTVSLAPSMNGGPGLKWAIRDGVVVAKRNLLQIPRNPQLLGFSTIQPIMFVVLFAYVFGGAIVLPGNGDYKEFLMAGIFTQVVAFSSATTSVGVAEDMAKGLVDRFRSMPMARSAVLTGRTLADIVRSSFQLLVMSICGLAVGWRINDGITRALLAFLLVLLFGFAMSWVGATIGLSVRSVEVANTAGFIWLFPLTFLSNAFVPTEGMPSWIRVVAEWNPVTATVSAARELFGNPNPFVSVDSLPGQHPIWMSLLWSIVILMIFVPLSVRRYRRATSR
jgi:ABC-2 type transport system permease protein